MENLKTFIESVIEKNEKFKNSYFWTPPQSASARRSYEKYHSQYGEFEFEDKKFEVKQNVDCSCRNVYYSLVITVDGEKKDVRALKKVLKGLNETV